MSIYYPGNGTTVYTGQDKADRVNELRDEAREHDRNSDTYQRIGGYSGSMAIEGIKGNQKREEAERVERYGR